MANALRAGGAKTAANEDVMCGFCHIVFEFSDAFLSAARARAFAARALRAAGKLAFHGGWNGVVGINCLQSFIN